MNTAAYTYSVDHEANIVGTAFVGTINASYTSLTRAFGQPHRTKASGEKVDAEWTVVFSDGLLATIYNWKDGPNYAGADGTPVEQINDWHIGAKIGDADVIGRISLILSLSDEKAEQERQQAKGNKVTDALSGAREIMDTIRSKHGDRYAEVVQVGMAVRKLHDLIHVLLGVCESNSLIPAPAAKIASSVATELAARATGLAAAAAGLVPNNEADREKEAEALMEWVERMISAEDSAAHSLLAAGIKKGD